MHAVASPQAVIRRKREGHALAAGELREFIAGIADGSLCDGQLGAFAMAVCLRGMDHDETVALTLAMRDSGRRLDWRAADLGGPVLDKHSTGGVGDCTSLLVAPMLAACGAFVPMLSGRGLGHTGGTLDKLGAIPGYRSAPKPDELVRVVRDTGLAIVGASADLAPADRRLYAVRDVTATVDAIPLITASILSKKLAAGVDALVMDVKSGNGASLPDHDSALALARELVAVANGAGLRTEALVTDMSQPLAPAAGNALELRIALACLRGEPVAPRLVAASIELCAVALRQGGLAADLDEARARARAALASGAAAERFARMVHALGGPADLFEATDRHLPPAPCSADLPATAGGWLAAIDTRALGEAVVDLGGGRRHGDDRIDTRVGLDAIVPVGSAIEAGQPLLRVHAADDAALSATLARLAPCFRIDERPPAGQPLVLARIDAKAAGA
ncbi:thymidine phosphorylase [Arenimonas caeni]|jgi:thymidine phosphorylase|uniref:thymidine phosphorylase n=1 Tax=Arenimonas caeni TaxID=2058085 RepID=UPI002A371F0A|nr:thymidine phosphorylase [Arenimonas caeni]MDY0022459.1 thymidine phosphorylase [Arenimonas caeni]